MTKKIEAIIREEKLNEVKNALREIGIVGMNVIEVRGHGRQGGIVLEGRAGTYQIDMLPRVQFNIVLRKCFENGLVYWLAWENSLDKYIQPTRMMPNTPSLNHWCLTNQIHEDVHAFGRSAKF